MKAADFLDAPEADSEAPAAVARTAAPAPRAQSAAAFLDSGGAPSKRGRSAVSFFELSPETLDQLERGYRTLKQGLFGADLGAQRRRIDMMDKVDRGEKVRWQEDPFNYRLVGPEGRKALREQSEASYVDSLKTIAQEALKISKLYHDPNAQEAIKAANDYRWRDAWAAFTRDPAGIVKDLSLSNATQMAPMAATGVVGAAVKGIPGLMLGFAGGSFPVDYATSLIDYLNDQGIDLSDTKAVDAKLREPDFIHKLQGYAMKHASAVATVDALTAGTLSPVKGPAVKAAARAMGNVGKEVAGEMTGEASGQLLATGKVKPGDVIAEGLAAGPASVGGSVGATVAHSRSAQPAGAFLDAPDAGVRAGPDAGSQARTSPASSSGRASDFLDGDQIQAAGMTQQAAGGQERAGAERPLLEYGAPTQLSADEPVAGRFALIEADDLVAPLDTDLREDQAFPKELEGRARERGETEQSVQDIVHGFDPARLGDATSAADGSPVVGNDGLLEAGVARAVAVKRLYQADGQKASDYRGWIEGNAARFGLDAAKIQVMQRPVLVRVREGTVDRAQFARHAAGPHTALAAGAAASAAPGTLAAEHIGRREYVGDDAPWVEEAAASADSGRPDAIRAAVRRLFNVPINERHLMNPRAAGIYKVQARAIRLRNQNDIDTLIHEVGHHFSETAKPVRNLMTLHQAELLALTPEVYAKRPQALRLEEGFAEFMRLYLTQRSAARARAPGFSIAFHGFAESRGHDRVLSEIHGMIDNWYRLAPAERILAKVGKPKASLPERIPNAADVDRFIFEVLDNWHPLKLMVRDLAPEGVAPSRDAFKAAHLLAGDAAIIEDWVLHGTIPFDPTKRADQKNYGKPLHEILTPVAGQLREFKAYLIARRAAELTRASKEHLFDADEIAAGLRLETPTFRTAAEEVYAYNNRLLDYAVEGGLLASEVAQKMRAYAAYIPFFREGEKRAVHSKKDPFHRLEGGTENLHDPIANLVQNTANVIYATNRNAVLQKAFALAKATPGGGRWIEQIPIPEREVTLPTKRILDTFAEQGVAIDPEVAKGMAAMQSFFVRTATDDPRAHTVIARVAGEAQALQVNNPMLWKALQAFEPVDLGIIGKLLAVPAHLLRSGVVLSPEFMARNFMRDTISGFLQSKRRLVPVLHTMQGFKEVATRSDAAKLFRAYGGAFSDLWHGESDQVRDTLERMAARGNFDPRTILTPGGVLRLLRRIGSVTEAGTRVAEFKQTAKAGDVDSLIDAAYNAREVSVDFGMHGHSPAVRVLTRITPFLNPAMQGLYKMARTGREAFFPTLLRGSILTAASMALFLANRGEDWYDELEHWERSVYWHFDVGLRDDAGKVIPVRIPKPFEWGSVFGSVPEALTELAVERDREKFAKRLKSAIVDVFGVRAIPTALLVPAELWANKNMFTGRHIVSEAKDRLEPELQYGPQTSLLARKAGAATDTSPAKIDHAVRGIFGTLGVYSVMLADQAVRLTGDHANLPPKTWQQMPVVKAFVHDPNNPNSRYITNFYDRLDKARRAEATLRRVDTDAVDAYYQKRERELSEVRGANATAKQIAALRRLNEDVLKSRDYGGDEKLQLVNENNALIRDLAKRFMKEAASGASRASGRAP